MTCVLWKADSERNLPDLLLKQIDLVEEEDHGDVVEAVIVHRTLKQLHTFLHTILSSKRIKSQHKQHELRYKIQVDFKDVYSTTP